MNVFRIKEIIFDDDVYCLVFELLSMDLYAYLSLLPEGENLSFDLLQVCCLIVHF
jgi:hypothetical protein